MNRLAGGLAVLAGLGFGIPALLGTRHFARYGQVWQLWGFPTYGGGPFERIGLDTSVPLLVGFLFICGIEVAVGILLLAGWEPALWLSLAMLPFELAYWIGFALPLGLVFGAARLIVTILAIHAR